MEDDLLSLAEEETGAESRWGRPRKRKISLHVDLEVVEWLQSHGPCACERSCVLDFVRHWPLHYTLAQMPELVGDRRGRQALSMKTRIMTTSPR